jgi:glyoxylate reductase
MIRVLFTNCSFDEGEIKKLKDNNIELIPAKAELKEDELIKALKGCDGYVIGGTDRATKKVIEETNLKLIIFYGAGYQDYVDLPSANAKSIIVAYTPKANSYTVAEHTVALILEGVKNIVWLNNTTKQGNWFRRRSWTLQGKTLGIIGMGTIGSIVARIMKNAFNMNILYLSRTPKTDIEKELGAKKVTLEKLIKSSDIISIHSSLNAETENIIDEKEFNLFQKHTVLVNVARAKIVNGIALKKALEDGKLAKAVFDAYYVEPAPKKEDDPIGLLSMEDDKFVVTPHTAYNTKEAFTNMNNMVTENLIAYAKSEEVPYKVS